MWNKVAEMMDKIDRGVYDVEILMGVAGCALLSLCFERGRKEWREFFWE